MRSRLDLRNCCRIESLEGRALCTITPGHLALMERSVAEVLPANNLYFNGNPVVTWTGLNGQTVSSVKADCTTYVTVLLKQAYGLTNTDFVNRFGVSSPSLNRYYDEAVADGALDGFKQISDVKPGDLFISKYADQTVARGHMTMIETAPVLVSTSATFRAYNVTILDVTGSLHTNDTRNEIDQTTGTTDTGVGRGDIRLYTDLNGNLDHWAWGTKSTSTTYTALDRPATFAKVPALTINSPTTFKATATGETSVNLTWKDNSGIEDGYIIQRSSDGGATWADIGDVGKNGNAYTDRTVVPGAYNYRVYAVAGASQSASAAAGAVTVAAAVPAPPTNVTATLSGASVQIAWNDNATNEMRYVLERMTDGGQYSAVATPVANATAFTDTTASAGHMYTYRLRAESLYAVSGDVESNTLNRATRSGLGASGELGGVMLFPTVSFDILNLARAGAAPSAAVYFL